MAHFSSCVLGRWVNAHCFLSTFPLVSCNAKIFSRCLLFPISTYWTWIIIWQSHRENQCGLPHSPTFVFLIVLLGKKKKEDFKKLCLNPRVKYQPYAMGKPLGADPCLVVLFYPSCTHLPVLGCCWNMLLGYHKEDCEPHLPQHPPHPSYFSPLHEICPFALCFWDLLHWR